MPFAIFRTDIDRRDNGGVPVQRDEVRLEREPITDANIGKASPRTPAPTRPAAADPTGSPADQGFLAGDLFGGLEEVTGAPRLVRASRSWRSSSAVGQWFVRPSDTSSGGVSPKMNRTRFRIDAPAYLCSPIIVSVGEPYVGPGAQRGVAGWTGHDTNSPPRP
ncbi:hypothetical protein [Micromonospora sp. NPDC005299]|uniref:hypothetical protein n=1 Tax=Micromonospora sp. NPDC005299 TaxID=3364231 RepID=UPI0036C004AD